MRIFALVKCSCTDITFYIAGIKYENTGNLNLELYVHKMLVVTANWTFKFMEGINTSQYFQTVATIYFDWFYNITTLFRHLQSIPTVLELLTSVIAQIWFVTFYVTSVLEIYLSQKLEIIMTDAWVWSQCHVTNDRKKCVNQIRIFLQFLDILSQVLLLT